MKELSNAKEFFIEVPLYRRYKIDDKDIHKIIEIIFYTGTIDIYCSQCKDTSTFKSLVEQTQEYRNYVNSISSPGSLTPFHSDPSLFETIINKRYYRVCFKCTRECGHLINFYIEVDKDNFVKVGQYPSQYDFKKSSIKQYNKILSELRLREFNIAESLASSGIGIGSFVYLRRIFESLIEEARINAKYENKEWNDEAFFTCRMDQKIDLLKEFLPSFLVENRTIYSILSKGVHQLEEEECLDAFEPVKLGIELILDEKIRLIEQKKKTEDASKSIQKIYERFQKK